MNTSDRVQLIHRSQCSWPSQLQLACHLLQHSRVQMPSWTVIKVCKNRNFLRKFCSKLSNFIEARVAKANQFADQTIQTRRTQYCIPKIEILGLSYERVLHLLLHAICCQNRKCRMFRSKQNNLLHNDNFFNRLWHKHEENHAPWVTLEVNASTLD